MPALNAVFIRVLEKIVYHAGHQRAVEARGDAGRDVRFERYAPAVGGRELTAAGLRELAQVALAHRIAVGAVLHAGEAEQLLYKL